MTQTQSPNQAKGEDKLLVERLQELARYSLRHLPFGLPSITEPLPVILKKAVPYFWIGLMFVGLAVLAVPTLLSSVTFYWFFWSGLLRARTLAELGLDSLLTVIFVVFLSYSVGIGVVEFLRRLVRSVETKAELLARARRMREAQVR